MAQYCYACQDPQCGAVTEVSMGMFDPHPGRMTCPACGKIAIRSVGDDGRRSSTVKFVDYYEPQLGRRVSSAREVDRIAESKGLTVLGADEAFTSPEPYRATEAEIRECKERAQSSDCPRIPNPPVDYRDHLDVRRVNLGD